MKIFLKFTLLAFMLIGSPAVLFASDSTELLSFHAVLDQLYIEMIPLCSTLISTAQAIAGFAALWYIGYRVWGHLARAESIDVYPLLRPFVIGFCIILFPSVIELMNGVLSPIVVATNQMVADSNAKVAELLKLREEQLASSDNWIGSANFSGSELGDREQWLKYTYQDSPELGDELTDGIGEDIKFEMSRTSFSKRNIIREWMSETLNTLYLAATLCINTLRTFQLIVLAILGPLVFGLSVFDSFRHSLNSWLARYVNVFLWLPVANIFGGIISKIQENMLRIDLDQISKTGTTFFTEIDTAYLVFLVIGIVGYFCVPTVSGFIVSVASSRGDSMTGLFGGAARSIVKDSNTSFRQSSSSTSQTLSRMASAFTGGYSGSSRSNGDTKSGIERRIKG